MNNCRQIQQKSLSASPGFAKPKCWICGEERRLHQRIKPEGHVTYCKKHCPHCKVVAEEVADQVEAISGTNATLRSMIDGLALNRFDTVLRITELRDSLATCKSLADASLSEFYAQWKHNS